MNIDLPYVQAQKRNGKFRYYYRRAGQARIRLRGEPGSAEFAESYNFAKVQFSVAGKKPIGAGAAARSPAGTVSGAIAAYYQHNSFAHALAPSTQAMRRSILEKLRAEHGDDPLRLLERRHVAAILGRLKPNPANSWLIALRGLMAFAIEVEIIKTDPTADIKKAKRPMSTGFHPWTEAEIAQFEAHHPIGSRARLALALLLYTAQRRSDIVRIGPAHIDFTAGTIAVKPQKTLRTTGKSLELPLAAELREAIAGSVTGPFTFLVTTRGAPYSAPGFSNWFREVCNDAGLPHCTAHGLRKAQCRRLAEAGCSELQIAAVTGHEDMAEIRVYTRDAAQKKMAEAAFAAARRTGGDRETVPPSPKTLYPLALKA